MSLRTPRHYPAALSLVCVALLLGACAMLGDTVQQDRDGPARAGIWQVLDVSLIGDQLVTGPADVHFMQPVAVAARGHMVYIVDVGHQQLFRYDARVDRITPFLDLKGVISSEEADIYLHRDLSFLLADPDGGRVLHYDREGRLIRVIEDRVNLGRPVAVAANDHTGYIFIADGFNDHVLVYNPAGLLEGGFGSRGRGPGKFHWITALAQGPSGYYVATRFGTHRVQVMDFNGRYLESFQEDTVTFPTAIAVSSGNLAFVSDYMADDIKVFDGDVLLDVIGGHGSGPGRFRRIMDLWIDEGFLYVADTLNRRIQILNLASWELSRSETLPDELNDEATEESVK